MIPAAVDYRRPGSIEEALDALSAPDAKVLAGGQSLLPAMKLRIARPSLVVDVGGLGLDAIAARGDVLAIGAFATWDALAHNDLCNRPALAAIADCARGIGDLQVRNLGTIGGGLVHADPAADMPAVVLALEATLVLRSRADEREVPATDFFRGPFMTVIAEGELLTEIRIPLPAQGSGSAYVAVEHPASGFALAGAAALVTPDGRRRVALTGVGASAFLLDGDVDGAEIYGDRFAPEEYRRALARTVVTRAGDLAERRSKEDA